MEFLKGLDSDLKKILLAGIRNIWTHTSTAMEGNTLTLGETMFIIEEGLTVSGKSLKDHQEVVGHARAIDLIYSMLDRDKIDENDLFMLHKMVRAENIMDVLNPIGAWKVEPNATIIVPKNNEQITFSYVPRLMDEWLDLFNNVYAVKYGADDFVKAYAQAHAAFVKIHPFYDGNGRIARLVSNLPVLKSGYPPIVIPKEKRREYISLLSDYHLAVGSPAHGAPMLLQNKELDDFTDFCKEACALVMGLIEKIREEQKARDEANLEEQKKNNASRLKKRQL